MAITHLLQFTDTDLQAVLNDTRSQVIKDLILHGELTKEQGDVLLRSQLVLVYRKGWFKQQFDRLFSKRGTENNTFATSVVRLSSLTVQDLDEAERQVVLKDEIEMRAIAGQKDSK